MFPYQGPTTAARTLKDLMRFHGNKMPAKLSEKLDAAVDHDAPVMTAILGMEWLWSAFTEKEENGDPVINIAQTWYTPALTTLGILAAEMHYGRHQEKGPRGEAIAAWVDNQIEGTGIDIPAPSVDPNYRFTPLPQPEPPVPGPDPHPAPPE